MHGNLRTHQYCPRAQGDNNCVEMFVGVEPLGYKPAGLGPTLEVHNFQCNILREGTQKASFFQVPPALHPMKTRLYGNPLLLSHDGAYLAAEVGNTGEAGARGQHDQHIGTLGVVHNGGVVVQAAVKTDLVSHRALRPSRDA